MRQRRFDELVQLYLDREIRPGEFRVLQRAVLTDGENRRRFDEACRFHFAERVALCPEERARFAREIAGLRGRLLQGGPGAFPGAGAVRPRYGRRGLGVPAWAGLAAALVAGGALFLQIEGPGSGAVIAGGAMAQVVSSPASRLPAVGGEDWSRAGHWVQGRERLRWNPAGLTEEAYPAEPSLASRLRINGLDPAEAGSATPLPELALSNTFGEAYQKMREAEEAEKRSPRIIVVVPKGALPARRAEGNSWEGGRVRGDERGFQAQTAAQLFRTED